MRTRAAYIKKYGAKDGAELYRLLQKEAASAAAVARKKKKMGIK